MIVMGLLGEFYQRGIYIFSKKSFFSCNFPPKLGVLKAQGQFRTHHCDVSDLRVLIEVGRTRKDQDVW